MAGRQSVVEVVGEGEAMATGHRENFVLHIAIERSPLSGCRGRAPIKRHRVSLVPGH